MATIKLICATTNKVKFETGQQILKKHGIDLVQITVDIDEIQSEDPETVVRDKAQKAYQLLQKPLVITDDSWSIPALNGFPGPYMKSVDRWFSPSDFLRLMQGIGDRRIILHKYLAYQDEVETVIFCNDIPGQITKEPRGNFGPSIMKVVALDADEGQTISEAYDSGNAHKESRLEEHGTAWYRLAEWHKQRRLT